MKGALLADGFYRANWKLTVEDGGATLAIDRFTPLPDDPVGTLEAITDEGEGLIAFLAPETTKRLVVL